MRGLNTTTSTNQSISIKTLTSFFKKLLKLRSTSDLSKLVLKSVKLEGLPLRIRPAFIILTFLSLLLLSLLGFHPTLAQHIAPPNIPFSDKILHFICFFLASSLFYFIWKVEESSRKTIWWWNWWNEGISSFVCGLVGSILSEFVQSLLPYKTFQYGDIIANLLGTSLGIFTSRTLTQNYRRKLELNRLYRPVHFDLGSTRTREARYDDDYDDDDDDEEGEGEEEEGLEEDDLLVGGSREGNEMEEGRTRAENKIQNLSSRGGSNKNGNTGINRRVEENPWDDREEIFGIGEDDLE